MDEIKSDYIFNLAKEINELKRKSVLKNGFDFIFIIDKDYTEFYSIIEHSNINIDVCKS